MIDLHENIRCGNCGAELNDSPDGLTHDRRPCSVCSSTIRSFSEHTLLKVCMRTKIKMNAKRPGAKEPYVESVSGDDLHRGTGQWMKLDRLIDREKDEYVETVVDPATGKVVHQNAERLSSHKAHGSAKYLR